MHEKGIKASDCCHTVHTPQDHRHRPRHHRRHLITEHSGEQRGQQPDNHFQPPFVLLLGPLESPQAPEQAEEVEVGHDGEGDGPDVVDGPTHRDGGVEGQEGEGAEGEPREEGLVVFTVLGLLRRTGFSRRRGLE